MADFAPKPVGWTFTDSNGAGRVKTRWQFNAYVTREGAKAAALSIARPGSTWYIWRFADGSYGHTAVPDPATPGHPAELVETVEADAMHRACRRRSLARRRRR